MKNPNHDDGQDKKQRGRNYANLIFIIISAVCCVAGTVIFCTGTMSISVEGGLCAVSTLVLTVASVILSAIALTKGRKAVGTAGFIAGIITIAVSAFVATFALGLGALNLMMLRGM